jgi:DNA invertase Pin-like site-specific DNA recombinase
MFTVRKKTDTLSSARAIGYVRVSKNEQQLSPGAQHDAITAWSVHNAIPVTAVYEDLGVSGATPATDRPGLSAALLAVAAVDADFLVVASRDRLSRDVLQTMLVEKQLADLPTPCRVVVATATADDPHADVSPEQQVMSRIVDAFAEYERAKIRSRTKVAVAKARELGRYPGPKVWYTCVRGQRTVQLIRALSQDLGLTSKQINLWLQVRGIFSPHRGVVTPKHILTALKLSEKQVPTADLGESPESLAAAVLKLSYRETNFMVAKRRSVK